MMNPSSLFKIEDTLLTGCKLIKPRIHKDSRGFFVKTYHNEAFASLGLAGNFAEIYYSKSRKDVLRGMHFQLPPADHEKLVTCIAGRVLDVALDLRRNSPTYGKHFAVHLTDEEGKMLYLPRGFAHGFLALSNEATLLYHVTSVYVPECDAGILWNSAGIDWGISTPILSERDRHFPPLAEFKSPF